MSFIGPEGRKQLQLAARFATAGVELVVCIVIGYFGGRALDRWLGTEPYAGYAGLILGVVAGFRNLFLLARRASTTPPAEARTNPENAYESDSPIDSERSPDHKANEPP